MTDFTATLAKRRQHAAALAEGYSHSKQWMEIGSVASFGGLFIWNCCKVVVNGELITGASGFVTCVLCAVAAILLADFLSGFVHWFMDTWGSVDMPVIGKSFIRSFREHHLVPAAMTKHSLTETNGDNCLLTLPVMALLARSTVVLGPTKLLAWEKPAVNIFTLVFTLFLVLFVCITNQIHKWSHMHPPTPPPQFVRLLQQLHIVLPPKEHNAHHTAPFDKYYCITTGWLNRPLEVIQFWRCLEAMISLATGQQPRADDMKWTGQ